MSGTPGFLLLSFLLLPLLLLLHSTKSQPYDGYTGTANLSSKWTNTLDFPHNVSYTDGSLIRVVLLRGINISAESYYNPYFACGFYCFTCTSTTRDSNFLFAIYTVFVDSNGEILDYSNTLPQVVWSANRNRPIKENATLEITIDGDLILKDGDGSQVWSTGTSGKYVVGMNLTESGNLILLGENGNVVWQSFDHPTDTILLGQKLMSGQKLTANTSTTNFTEGQYHLSVTSRGWEAYIDSTPPQIYYSLINYTTKFDSFIEYTNGNISIASLSFELPKTNSLQYITA